MPAWQSVFLAPFRSLLILISIILWRREILWNTCCWKCLRAGKMHFYQDVSTVEGAGMMGLDNLLISWFGYSIWFDAYSLPYHLHTLQSFPKQRLWRDHLFSGIKSDFSPECLMSFKASFYFLFFKWGKEDERKQRPLVSYVASLLVNYCILVSLFL